jgi:NAD(P)-dependent dehydrogenase (short-subunit alcohol dehydrogenase family)
MRLLVTGGAGYLGSAVLSHLAMQGHEVLSISSKKCEQDKETWSSQVTEVCLNISDPQDVEDTVARYLTDGKKFDGAVLMAGRGSRGRDFSMSGNEFAQTMSETTRTLYSSMAGARRHMEPNSGIVVFSSLWSNLIPQSEVYLDLQNEPSFSLVAGWGAQSQLIRYLAKELAPIGIRVNGLQPGWFPKPRLPLRHDYVDGIIRRIPLGRIGKPEDLLGSIDFLLGEGSKYITGQTIVVDGGYSLR